MSATALNLEAIQKALDAHAERCKAKVVEIQMAPFEVDRLGFDEFKGIPIVENEKMGTGRVRVVCDAMKPSTEGVPDTEVVDADAETRVPA